jgi:ribosome-associated protein
MDLINDIEFGNRDFKNELTFKTSRSSGPGGQHVNKTSSRVELRFDVFNSELLSLEEKDIILQKLSNRISQEGILIITSQESRSQLENKEIAMSKFYELITVALTPEKKRRPTKPTMASREKRIGTKRIQSIKKQSRKPPEED